ncbi:MAG: hypothetical protein BZY80_03140 [SAR202 cluster bacterium Io17-Chloro-G2]|nr:MAG: hypothetical protein BZY80_03140 [SAR202 cluster bacterium Io17-Chloro-G2]
MSRQANYQLKGQLLGGCNCDWGCPCNFEAPPTYVKCEGSYVWHVETGHYEGTTLDGSTFCQISSFPGPVHEGNGTALVLVDEKVPAGRRPAIEELLVKIPPFGVFHDLSSNFLGFRYAPFNLHLDGLNSRLEVPGILELSLTPIINPVTGDVEAATLEKPTGFTSKVQEMCSTAAHRLIAEGMSFECTGKYGEFSRFDYPL